MGVHPIGIMQGRLLPPSGGRIQSFPAQEWEREFAGAAQAGLTCIEWIYEEPNEALNPLGTSAGIAHLRQVQQAAGVGVISVCADYYMTQLLVDDAGLPIARTVAHLRGLLARMAEAGIQYFVLPFVDGSSLRRVDAGESLARLLALLATDLARFKVELHLETDLAGSELAVLMPRLESPYVRLNYDIGNSASLGHRPEIHLAPCLRWIGSVHVKDRVLGGGTVPLGQGQADFDTSFALLRQSGFARPYILQVARGTPGDEVAWATANQRYIRKWI
jgi:L-ribulose-5-phosphate 3-epimerase